MSRESWHYASKLKQRHKAIAYLPDLQGVGKNTLVEECFLLVIVLKKIVYQMDLNENLIHYFSIDHPIKNSNVYCHMK